MHHRLHRCALRHLEWYVLDTFRRAPGKFLSAVAVLFFLPQWVPHRRREDFAPIYRVFAILSLLLPVLILSNWGYISYLTWPATAIQHFYQIAGFALSSALIWLGLRRQWGEVVNSGVTFFVIFLYTKFFDWWWAILPKYLFFLVVGLTAVLFLFVIKRLRQAAHKREAA